jgi:hypothetical protein
MIKLVESLLYKIKFFPWLVEEVNQPRRDQAGLISVPLQTTTTRVW